MKITIWVSRDRRFNFWRDDFVSTLRTTKPLYWATQYSGPLPVSAFSYFWRLEIARYGAVNLITAWASWCNRSGLALLPLHCRCQRVSC